MAIAIFELIADAEEQQEQRRQRDLRYPVDRRDQWFEHPAGERNAPSTSAMTRPSRTRARNRA